MVENTIAPEGDFDRERVDPEVLLAARNLMPSRNRTSAVCPVC